MVVKGLYFVYIYVRDEGEIATSLAQRYWSATCKTPGIPAVSAALILLNLSVHSCMLQEKENG